MIHFRNIASAGRTKDVRYRTVPPQNDKSYDNDDQSAIDGQCQRCADISRQRSALKGHAEAKAKTGFPSSLYGIDDFRVKDPKACPQSDVGMLIGLAL